MLLSLRFSSFQNPSSVFSRAVSLQAAYTSLEDPAAPLAASLREYVGLVKRIEDFSAPSLLCGPETEEGVRAWIQAKLDLSLALASAVHEDPLTLQGVEECARQRNMTATSLLTATETDLAALVSAHASDKDMSAAFFSLCEA